MLEKISAYTARKFAPGSRPTRCTVVNWIRSGAIYGEQIGGTWFVDESVSVAKPRPTIAAAEHSLDTSQAIADRILRNITSGR